MKLFSSAFVVLIIILTGCSSKKSSCGCPYQSKIETEIAPLDNINFTTFLSVDSSRLNIAYRFPEQIFNNPISLESQEEAESCLFATDLISKAFKYQGTRYRRGGLSSSGFDCSGLVFKCFSSFGVTLPRSSFDMSRSVLDVPRSEAKVGDLIFFKTNRRKARINHVGIVTKINGKEIKFIHASIKSGVIESSTLEQYYANTYAKIGRVSGI